MSDDENDTPSLDYDKFEMENTEDCSDFATYAAALMNHLGTGYTPDYEEVALGMGHASNQISDLKVKAAWRKLHYKSCNRLIWYDLSMQRLSFTFPHQQVSPRSLPFYDEIISSRRIYLHLSDEVGVISLPNLYNLDVESFTLEDIMNHLEDGINLTKLYQAALWRFIVEHVFRDIPRLVYKDLLKRGIWLPKSQMAPQLLKTFLLVPPNSDSFGSFVSFVAKFKAVNPFWNPAEDVVRKAWSLSLYYYGLFPDITAATTASDSMWSTLRLETYWSKVYRSAVERLAYPDLEPLIEEFFEDNYFLVDDELHIIPLVRSAAYDGQDAFVEWAELYRKSNIQLRPSQAKITDEFAKYMKANHQATNAWIMQALSTTEAQQFWADNMTLCTANPTNSTVAALHNQITTLTGDIAARDTTITQLQNQTSTLTGDVAMRDTTIGQLQNQIGTLTNNVATRDATVSQLQNDVQTRDTVIGQLQHQFTTSSQQEIQMVDPAAHNALLQEVQFLRRFRNLTSVTAQAIIGNLSDLNNEFHPPS